MNRAEKRKKLKEINMLNEVVSIIRRYFPELINKFNNLTDLRNQSYVTYQMKVIFMVRLLGLMCEIKSMHEMTSELNTEEAIENIAKICGLQLEEIPHCDPINNVFEQVKVEEIEEIRKYIITKLIRGKIIKKFLVRDRYYHIIIDGTGLATSRKKYNDNCLVKNKTDKNSNKYQEYSTYVLEAKLVVGDMEFSKIVKENNESKKLGYEFVTKIDYNDYKINIIRQIESKEEIETEFTYMTDLPITNRNIESSIFIGRKRWKIENEGFNIQKNGTFDIGHLYSKNTIAIKVHYLMIQIAHIIRQMLEKGHIGLKEEIKERKIKIKEISSQIKKMLTSTHINLVNAHSTQLRFDG